MEQKRAVASARGEIVYFTGRPCKNGHTSPRYTKTGVCSECAKERARKQREDRESYNEYHREYSGRNIHLLKKYLRDPNEYLFEKRTRQRKALKQATPSWADRENIRSVYAHCVYLNETMHYPMEVDHVIPLHNKIVCGLHVAENLQVSSHTLNTQKGNTFNRVKAEKELMKWLKDRGL